MNTANKISSDDNSCTSQLRNHIGEMAELYHSIISGTETKILYAESSPELPKIVMRAANIS